VNQPTELQLQAHAMRVMAELTELAIEYGARKTPWWYITEGGVIAGRFNFDAEPTGAEMDPWRLAIGAHSVEHIPTNGRMGWSMTDRICATFRDMTINLSVVYPYTPVGLGATAVAV